MKKIFSLVLVLSLLFLSACAGSGDHSTTTGALSTADQNGTFKEYPGNTGIKIESAETSLPEDIYTTDASENGLKGNLYTISGVVNSSEKLDEATYFVIETTGGNVAVLDMLSYSLSESAIVDTDSLRKYFPLPSIGEQVSITAQYLGHSGSLNLAMFLYGGKDYFTEAYALAALDSMKSDNSTDSAGTSTQTDPAQTNPAQVDPSATDSPETDPPETTPPETTPPATDPPETTLPVTDPPVTTVPEETQGETTAPTESGPTANEKSALKSANDYLRVAAFSHQSLIDQLEYEGYTTAEATYAADNCGADWNEQALKSAKSYLKVSAFSYSGLVEQLEYENFTAAQAKYGADNCGADWNEQAKKSAASYLSIMSFTRNELIGQLEYEGFTHDQAVYGVEANGL